MEALLTEHPGTAARRRVSPRAVPKMTRLRKILITGDALSMVASYAIVLGVDGFFGAHDLRDVFILFGVVFAGGVLAVRSQGLFLARVSVVRVVEITRIMRAMTLLAVGVLLGDRLFDIRVSTTDALVGFGASVVGLVAWRSIYRSWVAAERLRGEHRRPMVVVGAGPESRRLIRIIETHPEVGIDVVGVVGSSREATRCGMAGRYLGEIDQVMGVIETSGVSSVIVCPSSIEQEQMNFLVRQLQNRDVHVFVSAGLAGIDARRLRSVSIVHEPMLYIESSSLSRLQLEMKRVFDIVLSLLLLVVLSPLLLAIAAAIKLGDRGPVFFRQERVGRNGRTFGLFKFRTMVVDAERHLSLIVSENQRNGPLFKMHNDPRVTRVGRFLRRSSLDELPQLFNVLMQDMSLVGPRPALPREVAEFSAELRARENVLPGITGLWQVEARDNPSFEAYRRLDLFYVENWSVVLDLLILISTLEHLVIRLVSSRHAERDDEASEPLTVLASVDD